VVGNHFSILELLGGDGAIRSLLRGESEQELHRDPTVGTCPKVWTRDQR